MCYICGKSSNKIVHTMDCRYVKMIPEKNRKLFRTYKNASEAGYIQCKYCAPILKYLDREEQELTRYCRANGLFYSFNRNDGSIDVVSRSGKWKIIINGKKQFIWLYHKNVNGAWPDDFIPGYHSQRTRSSSLMGYMRYIVEHDRYRVENPLYESQRHPNAIKGSKKWNKDRRREVRARKTQDIRYVLNLIDSLAMV